MIRSRVTHPFTGSRGLNVVLTDIRCIIQDDADDWNREAMKMASIYECAHITLAGESSEDGQQGLFRRSSFYVSAEVIGAHDTENAPAVEIRRKQFSQSSCSLLRRGWVFQEVQLSRRFIHFAPEEVVWECNCGSWCECGGPEWSIKQSTWSKQVAQRWAGSYDWHGFDRIVPAFSEMELTKKEDRLPALAGLASRYGQLHGNLTYLAGLWLEDMATTGLFWAITGKHAVARPEPLFAPTWSWASVGSSVRFQSGDARCSGLQKIVVRDYQVTPVEGGNQYGHLLKAHVRVSGLVVSGRLVSYGSALETPEKYGYSLPLSAARIDGVQQSVLFKPDYDLGAASKYKVDLGSKILYLFGYAYRYTTEDGSLCGSSSSEDEDESDDENRGENGSRLWDGLLHTARFPGGIVIRCVDEEANHFERIGLFDAKVCTWGNSDWELGKKLLECLKGAVRRDVILV